MGLLGALFGGSVGFMLGGPIGAMLGGALGASYGDTGGARPGGAARRIIGRCPNCRRPVSFATEDDLVCPHCHTPLSTGRPTGGPGASAGADESARSAFMVALISLAAKVAKADGHISPEEVHTFDTFLRNDLAMSATDRKIAARIFNEARDSGVPATDFARQLRSIMAAQPDRLRDLVALLLRIAFADGRLDPAEERLIRQITTDLGLSSRDYDQALALCRDSGNGGAYAVLGLESTASNDDVKKAYRRLAREYHPDVLAAKNLPKDFMTFAKEKLQTANAAYHEIKKSRGF